MQHENGREGTFALGHAERGGDPAIQRQIRFSATGRRCGERGGDEKRETEHGSEPFSCNVATLPPL
ncbi:hypothetical protein [Paracoccus siganidrum]|uniref:hypothetical protein n=1 Tax=Paracoccus siganidrum TaxID=1276757 RepID=UPI001604ED74|nr:hypothetical protein [Paracoccus siganidrum]